jgi:benzoylformate decarboxylase
MQVPGRKNAGMGEATGRDVLLEVLRTEGVRHVFGNPGSTELPLIDALAAADDLHYVLALQEATAVGMADGYAQATGRPSFLNLHTSAGLGNAIGNLTNARANSAPIVVTAGQQHTAHLAADPLLAGDLVGLARATVKWAHEVRSLGELGTVLRRAFHDAAAPPAGPVFTSIRMDTLDEEGAPPVPPPSRIDHRAAAGALGGLEELAELLAGPGAGNVAIVLGDEVSAAGAIDEAVALAEALGAPVLGAPLHGTAVFPPAHALWDGMLPPAARAINAKLAAYRRVLLIGGQAFLVYPYTSGSPVPDGVELLHLASDAGLLGRAHPTRLALSGDTKATLSALLPLVRARADAAAAADVLDAARTRRLADIERLEQAARDRYRNMPIDPMAAGHALVRALPPGTPIVDEAITTGVYVRGFHHDAADAGYFFCKGGGLGWGMPAACGVSLARDKAPVMCAVGDGSAMYSPQALWTAAHEQLPVLFAIVNNRQYRILKDNLAAMGGDSVRAGRFVGMDLVDPPIDFVALAGSMGVSATLVERADDVGDALRAALASGKPHLLELPISAPPAA